MTNAVKRLLANRLQQNNIQQEMSHMNSERMQELGAKDSDRIIRDVVPYLADRLTLAERDLLRNALTLAFIDGVLSESERRNGEGVK